MTRLTPRELEVVATIRRLTKLHGSAPTRSELGHALGITKVTAHLHVMRLRKKHVLSIEPRRHRGISFFSDRPLPQVAIT
jgi:SOS-response transcriptional repressor LexA